MDKTEKNLEIKLGTRIRTGFQNGIYKHSDSYSDNGIQIVRINDYDNDGTKRFNCLKRVDLEPNETKRFSLKEGDLLINRVNSLSHIGKVCIIREVRESTVFESNMMRLRIEDDANILPYFLFFSLQSSRARDYLRRVAKPAVAQASINQEDIKSLSIYLPDLKQQAGIANLLFTWDTTIDKIERLIAVKERRFAVLQHSLIYKESLRGNWPEVKLGSVFRERVEKQFNNLPLLSITREEGVVPRDELNRKDTSNNDKSRYLRICPGDIGYNTMRMWQGVSALSKLEGIVSPAYTICIPSDDLHGEFVAHYFKTPFMIHKFYRFSQGLTSDTWNLKFKHFKEIRAAIPPLDQQKNIAAILNTARREIDVLKKQLDAYRRQKRGLMQKLLTGQWRVKIKED